MADSMFETGGTRGGVMGARFRILGRTGLVVGNQLDDHWGRPKWRGLLAALLLNPGRAVELDTLAEWIWPLDRTPQQLASTVYTYASRVRDELARMDQPPRVIASGGGAYRIDIDKSDVDFYVFQDMIDRARQLSREGEHGEARNLFTSGIELWIDRPLADLDGERADRWRRWAEAELLIPAHSGLVRELAALGEFDEALRRLDEMPVEYQENLTIMKLRLEVLFGLHRTRDATTYFLASRKRLRNDFDHAEAEELTRFYDRLFSAEVRTSDESVANRALVTVTSTVPRHLPRGIPDFDGREDLLRRLDEIVPPRDDADAASITVLEGQPGVGKSALAVHWANRAARLFPDGQLYLDLNGFADTPRIEAAAAVEHLLVQLDSPTEPTITNHVRNFKLRSLIVGRKMLVVLDNARNTGHVKPLVELLPCAMLITSSRHLSGLARRGATIVPVTPLNYPESRQLLVRRLGARAHIEPAALSVLTGMCGGNILELRLVAQHIARKPRIRLAEFVDELRGERELLELGDDEDNPGGSIGAAFSLSYQALDPDEQRMFRLLGTHPGPDISLDAAAALMGTDRPWVKRRLDALVDAYLLAQPEERARYRLHALLRKFAATCVAKEEYRDERAAAEERILSYYHHAAHNADKKIFPNRVDLPTEPLAGHVTPLEFEDDQAALRWLLRERANLNAIIHFANTRNMLEYVTIMSSSTGEAYQRQGYSEDVLVTLRDAVRCARDSGDILGQAYSLHNLGFVQLNLRQFAAAESSLRSAEMLFREVPKPEGIAGATINLARLSVERGDYLGGIRGYRAALSILHEMPSPRSQGMEIIARCRLAKAYRLNNDLDEAVVGATDARRLAEQAEDGRGLEFAFAELAEIYFASDDLVAARGYCVKSIALHKRYPEAELAGRTWYLLGCIHRKGGDLRRAEGCFRAATTGYRDGRDTQGEATAYDLLGSVLEAQGRIESAVGAWSRSVALFERLGIYDGRVDSIRMRLVENSSITHASQTESTRPLDEGPDLTA